MYIYTYLLLVERGFLGRRASAAARPLIGRAGGNGAKPNLLASAPRVAPSLKHEKRVLGLTQVGRYVGRQVGLRVNPTG